MAPRFGANPCHQKGDHISLYGRFCGHKPATEDTEVQRCLRPQQEESLTLRSDGTIWESDPFDPSDPYVVALHGQLVASRYYCPPGPEKDLLRKAPTSHRQTNRTLNSHTYSSHVDMRRAKWLSALAPFSPFRTCISPPLSWRRFLSLLVFHLRRPRASRVHITLPLTVTSPRSILPLYRSSLPSPSGNARAKHGSPSTGPCDFGPSPKLGILVPGCRKEVSLTG